MPKIQKWTLAVLFVCIGATLVFIWGHSLMPATGSKTESDTVKRLLSLVFGEGAVAAFLLDNIRKVAHFAEFALLGAEVCALRRMQKAPVSWLYGLGVAAVDELLQFAAPGRSPQVTDVLLDYSGYLCGFGFLAAIFGLAIIFRRFRKN